MRVIEVGVGVGVAAAGLLLASLGADVVQVRLPGRRVPDAEAAYYDRGRLTVEPAAAATLGPRGDVVVTDRDASGLAELGLPTDCDQLRQGVFPQVLVSIRSLGASGPSSAFRMTNLTEWASGGLATVTRRPHPDDPECYVPVLPPGFQPQALAGLAGATAVFVARRWARSVRKGVAVDVSVQEVVAATLHSTVPNFVLNAHTIGHPSTPYPAAGFLVPAADGDVYIRTVEQHQWDKLMAWMGEPDWAPLGADAPSRLSNREAIAALLAEWTIALPRDELVREGQARKVPVTVARSLAQVLEWQHLRARGEWVSVEYHGSTVEGPALPMFEPPRWMPTRSIGMDEASQRWPAR